ncbi:hypothetical protein M427DRAFT_51700 [Gonapodya prolifera JEL478]|uniref:Uncharacterized protein n=1 Tax=Gonapodya prolifera (strain JEL478) TaxID=1344416 RepID=A0A139AVG2_GONPJ|nr:hypothetical protein M427DRAFT_51700 [Gonapodya prolifera JEL478]|eukprot:KXS20720.1 hypothetical protein M427DRAFT_51700 [Gonapodya prolifera JEL478]
MASPDSELLASFGSVCELWSPAEGTPSDQASQPYSRLGGSFHRANRSASCVTWSHDGALFAYAQKQTISIFDVAAGTSEAIELGFAPSAESITALRFYGQSRYLVFGGNGRVVRCWDRVLRKFAEPVKGPTATITSISVNLEDSRVAVSTQDGRLAAYNMASNSPRVFEQPSRQNITTTAWSRLHRALLACAGDDGHLYLYDVNHGAKALAVMRGAHDGPVGEVCFSQSGRYSLWSAGWDGRVKMTDVEKKKTTWATSTADPATSVTAHGAGTYVAVGDSAGFVQVFDLRHGLRPVGRWPAHKGGVKGVRYQDTDRRTPSSAPKPLFTLSTPTKPRQRSASPARSSHAASQSGAIGGGPTKTPIRAQSISEMRDPRVAQERELMGLFSPVVGSFGLGELSTRPEVPKFNLPDPRIVKRVSSTTMLKENAAGTVKSAREVDVFGGQSVRADSTQAGTSADGGRKSLEDGDVMSMFSPVSKLRPSATGGATTTLFRSLSSRTRSGPQLGPANPPVLGKTPPTVPPSTMPSSASTPGSPDVASDPDTPSPPSPGRRDRMTAGKGDGGREGTDSLLLTGTRRSSASLSRERKGQGYPFGEALTLAELDTRLTPPSQRPSLGTARVPAHPKRPDSVASSTDFGSSRIGGLVGHVQLEDRQSSRSPRFSTIGTGVVAAPAAEDLGVDGSPSLSASTSSSHQPRGTREHPQYAERHNRERESEDVHTRETNADPPSRGPSVAGSAAMSHKEDADTFVPDAHNISDDFEGKRDFNPRISGSSSNFDHLAAWSSAQNSSVKVIPEEQRSSGSVSVAAAPPSTAAPPSQTNTSALATYLNMLSPPLPGTAKGPQLESASTLKQRVTGGVDPSTFSESLGNIEARINDISTADFLRGFGLENPSAILGRKPGNALGQRSAIGPDVPTRTTATTIPNGPAEPQPVSSDYQHQILENTVDQALQRFRAGLRNDIQNMHLELLRQFQLQRDELEAMLIQYSPAKSLMDELQALREENERLRCLY